MLRQQKIKIQLYLEFWLFQNWSQELCNLRNVPQANFHEVTIFLDVEGEERVLGSSGSLCMKGTLSIRKSTRATYSLLPPPRIYRHFGVVAIFHSLSTFPGPIYLIREVYLQPARLDAVVYVLHLCHSENTETVFLNLLLVSFVKFMSTLWIYHAPQFSVCTIVHSTGMKCKVSKCWDKI